MQLPRHEKQGHVSQITGHAMRTERRCGLQTVFQEIVFVARVTKHIILLSVSGN